MAWQPAWPSPGTKNDVEGHSGLLTEEIDVIDFLWLWNQAQGPNRDLQDKEHVTEGDTTAFLPGYYF